MPVLDFFHIPKQTPIILTKDVFMHKFYYLLLLSGCTPLNPPKEISMEELMNMPFEKVYNIQITDDPKTKNKK